MFGAGTREPVTRSLQLYTRKLPTVQHHKMSLPYVKANCTRYRTLIEKEISKSEEFITKEFTDEELSVLLRQVESSIRRLKDFSGKLEENVEKWSMAVEVKDIDPQEKDKFTDVSEREIIYFYVRGYITYGSTYDSGEKFTEEKSSSEISTGDN